MPGLEIEWKLLFHVAENVDAMRARASKTNMRKGKAENRDRWIGVGCWELGVGETQYNREERKILILCQIPPPCPGFEYPNIICS